MVNRRSFLKTGMLWIPTVSIFVPNLLRGQQHRHKRFPYRYAAAAGGISDDFNRANENPIVGNWTTGQGGNNLRLLANTIQGQNSNAMAVWDAATFANDQWSQATAVTPVAGYFDGGVCVRGSLSALTNYLLHGYSAGTYVKIGKWVAGSMTSDLFSAAYTWTDGATIRIEAEGSTIRAIVNGSTRTSGTDTDITSGYAGFWIYDTSYKCDDWSGGDI